MQSLIRQRTASEQEQEEEHSLVSKKTEGSTVVEEHSLVNMKTEGSTVVTTFDLDQDDSSFV